MRKGDKFIYLCDCACNQVRFMFQKSVTWKHKDGTEEIEDGWLVISMEPNPHGFWVRFKRMWTYLFKPKRFFDGGDVLSELNSDENKGELRDLIAFLQESLDGANATKSE